MTPGRRLDQLEPLLADALQKIDRLVDGQGKLTEFAVNTKAELEEVKVNLAQTNLTVETTARAVANLTVTTQRQFDELREGQRNLEAGQQKLEVGQRNLEAGLAALNNNQQKLETGLFTLNDNQQKLEVGLATLGDNQQKLETTVGTLVRNQQKLEEGQQLILQILRDKLS